jgi:glutathione synthase/RimK-type ligase-like ATP-grasp enzyme
VPNTGRGEEDLDAGLACALSAIAAGDRPRGFARLTELLRDRPVRWVPAEPPAKGRILCLADFIRRIAPRPSRRPRDQVYRRTNFAPQLEGRGYDVGYGLLESPRLAEALAGEDAPDVAVTNFTRLDEALPDTLLPRYEEVVASLDAPVLNPLPRVLRLSRDGVARELAGRPGLVVPPTLRLDMTDWDRETALKAIAAAMDYPVILRPLGTHLGSKTMKADTPQQAAAYLEGAQRTERQVYATAFVETEKYQGRYVRYRTAWIGGRALPLSAYLGRGPFVHGRASRAETDANPELLELDRAFVETPSALLGETACEAVEAVLRETGLDICGIDFGLDAEGRAVFFECNPQMRLLGRPHQPSVEEMDHRKANLADRLAALDSLLARAIAGGRK